MAQREARSVLFTDVENSTRLRVERGDDAAAVILGVHDEIARREIAVHGGVGAA